MRIPSQTSSPHQSATDSTREGQRDNASQSQQGAASSSSPSGSSLRSSGKAMKKRLLSAIFHKKRGTQAGESSRAQAGSAIPAETVAQPNRPAAGEAPELPEDIRGYLAARGATRLDKNEQGARKATEIVVGSHTYQLQYGLDGKVGGELGDGASGRVRTALLDGSTVTANKKFKVNVRKEFYGTPYESVRAAEHEYSVYQKLDGGHYFPKVYDLAHVLDKDGAIKSYLFMEKLEGKSGQNTLDEMKENNELPLTEARKQVKETVRKYVEAVADMHDRGVVHGDLHPGNFFHDFSGNIKVLDFGLAKGLPENISADVKGKEFATDMEKLGFIIADLPVKILRKYDGDEGVRSDRGALNRLANRLEQEKDIIQLRALLQESYFAAK
jgi:hypothetical protein